MTYFPMDCVSYFFLSFFVIKNITKMKIFTNFIIELVNKVRGLLIFNKNNFVSTNILHLTFELTILVSLQKLLTLAMSFSQFDVHLEFRVSRFVNKFVKNKTYVIFWVLGDIR